MCGALACNQSVVASTGRANQEPGGTHARKPIAPFDGITFERLLAEVKS
jgi:hypothetical protein